MDIVSRIRDLQSRSAALEVDAQRFARDLAALTAPLADFVASAGDAPAFPEAAGSLKPGAAGTRANDPLLATIHEQLRGGIETGSGHFLGYIPGGGLLSAAYADLIAAVTNRYAGLHFAAPGAAETENRVIRWLVDKFGLPATAWGSLTSGGTTATLHCLLAALETVPDADRRSLLVYLTRESHHCVTRCLKVLGFTTGQIRFVSTDAALRMDCADLEAQVSADADAGLTPFAVIANAGTTHCGAIDPLDRIADLASHKNLWFHVDGAYGGFFRLVPSLRERLRGIERADSLVVDPHKGMFLPYGVGASLVRDRQLLRQAFSTEAAYLADTRTEREASPADYSFELTRHNRAPRIQLSLDLFGEEAFAAALEEKCLLARHAYARLREIPDLELLQEPELSVVLMRARTDELTRRLHHALNTRSPAYLSTTQLSGQLWIRVCVLSFRTHLEHVETLVTSVKEAMSAVKTEDRQ